MCCQNPLMNIILLEMKPKKPLTNNLKDILVALKEQMDAIEAVKEDPKKVEARQKEDEHRRKMMAELTEQIKDLSE